MDTGLSLRGHRDHGNMSLDLPIENDGNFRALLRFAIYSGDISLKNRIENTGRNSLYISPQIQNEIAHIAGGVIQRKIIKRINKSQCFSIIADETTDVSGIEQFSICIRYVEKVEKEHSLREDFSCFVPVEDTTGAGLANTLVNELRNLKLNLENIRGQGYDGARSMSGEFKGCASKLRSFYPDAVYVHCANHSLNLAV
ncbi:52 kDa repressor of the inhibitor of the protein kinase-like isoform X2 [Haematobia irritans]|uniref:52 kDa repressor of the inhibitor of the protein kinase-like isoform X2 n=1 Tax=Haematobia irritans TaxID=7368 RepID=UPI003F4FC6F5